MARRRTRQRSSALLAVHVGFGELAAVGAMDSVRPVVSISIDLRGMPELGLRRAPPGLTTCSRSRPVFDC